MKNFLLLILIFTISHLSSQVYRQFKTNEYEIMISTPESQITQSQIESRISEFLQEPRSQNVTIPIVFHVLYDGSHPFPEKEQIVGQLEALNYHYSIASYEGKHQADKAEDFQSLAADTQIGFCLAGIDPFGNPTDGINYIKTSLQFETISNDMKDPGLGGVEPWDPDKYLNIWVCNFSEPIAGYAQMPGGNRRTDGIVIDYKYIGTSGTAVEPYNQGKTLTHLIGNYFFLYDIWGPCYCCDDRVADTPIHNGANFGPNDIYKHVTLCEGNGVEMTMNYMDNTDDGWMYMFTKGQKDRMQAVLAEGGPRSNLNSISLCQGSTSSNRALIQLNIFPNPSNDFIDIEYMNMKNCQVIITDRLGKILLKDKFYNKKKMDVSTWPKGVYTLSLITENETINKNFIVIK